jgi:hypothetical protein
MADDPMLQGGEGAIARQKLLDQGHSQPEVDDWQKSKMEEMYHNGNSPEDIKSFWNLTEPDYTNLEKHVNANIGGLPPEAKEHLAESPWETFAAGLQHGAIGLTSGKPSLIAPENAGLMQDILYQSGQAVSDIPLMVAGAVGGGMAGAAGGPIGALAGGGAGVAALPEAYREIMMEHYADKAGPFTWNDLWAKTAAIAMNTGKAAVMGAGSAAIGGAAGGAVLKLGASKLAAGFADVGAMATSATTIGAGMEGRVPNADDFVSGAVLALGFKGAGHLVGATSRFVASDATAQLSENLRDAYTATGQHPLALASDAQHDVVLRGEIMGPKTATGESVTPELDAMALRDPKPYNEPAAPKEGEVIPPSPMEKLEADKAEANSEENKTDRSLTIQGDKPDWVPPLSVHTEEELTPPKETPWAKIDVGEPPKDPTDMEKTWYYAPDGPAGDRFRWSESKQEYVLSGSLSSSDKEYINSLVEPKVGEAGKELTYWWRGTSREPKEFDPADTNRMVKATWITSSRETAEDFAGDDHVSRVAIQPGKYFDFRDPAHMGDLRAKMREYGIWNRDADRIQEGHWEDLEHNKHFQEFLKAEGYEGYFEREDLGKPVNLAVFRKDKIHLLGTTKLTKQAIARRGEAPTDLSPPRPPKQDYSKPGVLAYIYKQGERPEEAKATEAGVAVRPPGGGKPPEGGGPRLVGGPEPEGLTPNWQIAHSQIMDFIAPEIKQGIIPGWLNPRKWFAAFQSQLTPARELDFRLGLDPRQVGVEDMYRQVYGSAGRAATVFHYGTPVMAGNSFEIVGDKSFKSAYGAVKEDGGTVDGFTTYRMAKRTLEKAAQGIDTGVDLEAARLRLTEPGVEKKYARGSAIMQAAKDGAIDYAVDGHMLSAEGAEAMKRLNKEHIFFNRVMDPTYKPPNPGRSFAPKSPTQKMEGGTEQIHDPVTADFDNTHAMIAMADRNIARLNLLRRLDETNQQQIRAGKEATIELNKVDASWLDENRVLEGELLDERGVPIPDTDARGAYPLTVQRVFNAKRKDNQFLVFFKGKPEVWQSNDPQIQELMQMTFAPGSAPELVKMAQKFAGIQRAGIATRPIFAFRSLMHQQFAGTITGQATPYPFANFFSGIADVLGHSEAYQRALANGALNNSIVSLDDNFIKRQVGEVFDKTNTWDSVRNMAQHPFDAWRGVVHMLHEASGVGAMKRFENRGFSSLKAASLSRTEYLDQVEPMSASWAQQFARMVPYMSVGFKDIEQLVRALQDRPISTMVKGFSWLTLPTVLNFVANYYADKNLPEGQKYEDLPEWRRMLFFNLPPINGVRIPIPRPYVSGFFFAAIPEMFLRWWVKDDPHAFDHWGRNMLAQYVPPFVPSIAVPVAEDKFNTDFLTGRPLVPTSMEAADGYMQYTQNTSEPSKALARVLGKPGMNVADWSPIVMDNYARQWTGPLGMGVLNALGAHWKDPGPPAQWADNPLVGSFIAREGKTNSQVFTNLYDKLGEYDRARADRRLAEQRLNLPEMMETATSQSALDTSSIRHSLQEQMAAIHAIGLNKTMTDAEKLKGGDQLTSALVGYAKQTLTALDKLK